MVLIMTSLLSEASRSSRILGKLAPWRHLRMAINLHQIGNTVAEQYWKGAKPFSEMMATLHHPHFKYNVLHYLKGMLINGKLRT